MFEMVSSTDIQVDGFDIYPTASGSVGWAVYTSTTTVSSVLTNSSAWTMVGSGTITATASTANHVTLTSAVSMPSGTTLSWHITLMDSGRTVQYTNGTTVGRTYISNADLAIREGYGKSYPFSSSFSPRIWNGTVYYSTACTTSTWYRDADSDGYGASSSGTSSSCTAPAGYVATNTDCDDGDADSFPGSAPNDSATACMNDDDGDNYGDVTVTGSVVAGGDCNDASSAIHPGVSEYCDLVDNGCDGTTDEADSVDAANFYDDNDVDSYGNPAIGQTECYASAGFVSNATDCDDADADTFPAAAAINSATACMNDDDGDNYGDTVVSGTVVAGTDCDDAIAAIHPGATEICDAGSTDEDCDGLTDDGDLSTVGETTWYIDYDADGYGDTRYTRSPCDQPAGYVTNDDDCDDAVAGINPASTEICDAANTDEDCDGLADNRDSSADASGKTIYYVDADADSFGSTTTGSYCDLPSGYVTNAADCDDTTDAIYPSAPEVLADGIDNDCDRTETCYADADDDGYRTESPVGSADGDCDDSGEALATTANEDCDDTDTNIHPGAADAAGDAVDSDCDSTESCYVDADGDGARTAFTVASSDSDCADLGEALSTADLDCDDLDATAYPDATELLGAGVDEDCDGGEICYLDADDDGYRPDSTSTLVSVDDDCDDAGEALASELTGDCDDTTTRYNPAAAETDCADPADYNCDGSVGYADADADGWAACEECDDNTAAINPDAAEVAGDAIDSDCDGVDVCFVDADDDGYRPDLTSTIAGTTVACGASGEAAGSEPDGDCDDADASVSPSAIEVAGDDFDQDCDGGEICYVDNDGDTFRTGDTVISPNATCDGAGEASALAADDCNDANAAINPDAIELAGDEIDQDCDNEEVCYTDADDDGFRPDATSTVVSADTSCADAGEALSTDEIDDCNHADAAVNPDAIDITGDEVDSDCDGVEVCYLDADDDGYRPDDTSTVDSSDEACSDTGEALAGDLIDDCDDADPAYHPGATEDDCADPNDYNCDGSVGFADADADGFAACDECNDADATVYPGAADTDGDAIDSDCDGLETCFVDADDDGYRPDETSTVSTTNIACDGAGEALATDLYDDCDDADATIYPSATEIVGDEVDSDCDGTEYCYIDVDADGYQPDGGAVVLSSDLLCEATSGEAVAGTPDGDCDDTSAAFHPGAGETDCEDPADYNCDGSSGYADVDADGFAACEECDDAVSAVNPDATEICNDIDDDCDGVIDGPTSADAQTWCVDADADGYTDADKSVTDCAQPEFYVDPSDEADCDDLNNTVHPDATERPDDGIDQDCDGTDLLTEDTGTTDTGSDTGDHGIDIKDTGGDGKTAPSSCGCASATESRSLWALLLPALALFRLRRRR